MSCRVLFLTKYDQTGASSRYRVYQFLPFLDAAGIEYTVCPLLPPRYVRERYQSKANGFRTALASGVIESFYRRVRTMLYTARLFDLVFIQYEALPYIPYEIERSLLRADRPVITDYDDATFVTYAQHRSPVVRRLLGDKIARLVRASAHVIVGNRYLGDWASEFSENVTVIPTSVDLQKYPLRPEAAHSDGRAILVWIGTPLTARYLRLVGGALRSLRAEHDFALKVIGAPSVKLSGVNVVHVPWSELTEGDELAGCAAGMMPLSDGLWERGKSALKLIQYMAAGIVGVASPVGANCDVVRDGENGFLADTDDEWIWKLSATLQDDALRRRLARAGRATVETRFSLQANAGRWVNILRKVCSGGP